jgi:hypothetical protein
MIRYFYINVGGFYAVFQMLVNKEMPLSGEIDPIESQIPTSDDRSRLSRSVTVFQRKKRLTKTQWK